MGHTEVVVRDGRTRWLAWRDVLLVLLVVGNLLQLRVTDRVQDQARETSALRTMQIEGLSAQVALLREQLGAKDARIRQLTDLLIAHRIPVPPSPVPAPEPTLRPSATFTPRPQRTPSPAPAPHPTASHTPSPSPSCLVVANGTCITPPPVGGPFAR